MYRTIARLLGRGKEMTNIVAGNHAPGFKLQAIDGKEYELKELLAKGPVLVAFFKISCPVCQFTFPFLQRLHERYAGDGVNVIGVSQDDAKSTTRFNKDQGVKFTTLLDEHPYPASNAYGLTTVPSIFLIDPDGTVKVSCTGFSKADLEQITAELADARHVKAAPLFRADEVVPAVKPG